MQRTGKSDRLLDDNAVMSLQADQLRELEAKREQLQMMNEWRKELRQLKELEVDSVCELWKGIGITLNGNGRATVSKLIEEVLF